MSIAVDQTRLRQITERIAPGMNLTRDEGETILQIVQLAAGADEESHPQEHAVLQQVAQHIGASMGMEVGELHMIPKLPEEARAARLVRLGRRLSPPLKDIAFTLAFLVSIADLDLVPAETTLLEEFQLALGVSDRRAMDLVVILTERIDGSREQRPLA